MPKKTCPVDCTAVNLAAIPVETARRAFEAGMGIDDLLAATVKANGTCCAKAKAANAAMKAVGSFDLNGLIALIQELEALIAAFVPGA